MLTRRSLILGAAGAGLSGPGAAQAENRFTAFFSGRVTGEGTARNLRSGKTRGVKVMADGKAEGSDFLLRQAVVFSDGENQSRQWRFRPSGDGYVGVAADVIGEARLALTAQGALLSYKARTNVDGETHDLNFQEAMSFTARDRLTNVIGVKFWLLSVGELRLILQKRA